MGFPKTHFFSISRLPVAVALSVSFLFPGLFFPAGTWAQTQEGQVEPQGKSAGQVPLATTEDWNRRLQNLLRKAEPSGEVSSSEISSSLPALQEYRIGPDDLLELTVFEAPELNRTARVSARGEISLPLLGGVQAAGLTSGELESVLEELLRRTYMKDPHVGVFVAEMESHPVSVVGAVAKPGVYQIRGTKTLLEVLSMAQGLAEDAGNTVLVMRSASLFASATGTNDEAISSKSGNNPPELMVANSSSGGHEEGTLEVNLKDLLESGDPRYNVPVYPGDIVKVTRAGVVYVVGEVKKPGGFVLKTNENISVLQAIALAEGPTSTAARSKSRIIRTDEVNGERSEIPIDLGKILEGKETDPMLQAKDIVFVPNSAVRKGFYRGTEAAISIVSGLIIWRR